ncbi:MAG: BatD family protein [Halieaceae bacterium]|jgi:hypothetical protein|nr:BatD family protein [Halieaceae bacterium]
MKTFAGKLLTSLGVVALLLWATAASARLTAEVDRSDIAMGETLRLILTGDAGERPDEVDLRELERDFEILKSSSATSARLVNGSQSVTRTLELELAPRREGLVTIPSFVAGGRTSTPIAIKVSPAPDIDAGDALVLFDAAVDNDSVYVQAQLMLTVTLQQAINLDQREVTPFDLPNADVEMLEQRTFQRQVNGRLWQVIELRYAIFPQESGTLEIPSLTFSGREILPGRSLLGARLGRRIRIQTEPQTIVVKPVPDNFPGDVWLPAESLTINESWSKPPETLALGDSSTRTLEITADGLQGSQLPPIPSLDAGQALNGLKFYPGEETIDQAETPRGLRGRRLQSEALVPSQPGDWQLPARRLAWWNTRTDQLEYAELPARSITVTAALLPNSTSVTAGSPLDAASPMPAPPGWLWFVGGSGWLVSVVLALLLWFQWRRGSPYKDAAQGPSIDTESERRALVAMRLACQQNDPQAARNALLAWARCRWRQDVQSLDQLRQRVAPPLTTEIDVLNRALYGTGGSDWQGQSLFAAVREAPKVDAARSVEGLSLYPTAS